jgi:hypothetical protein
MIEARKDSETIYIDIVRHTIVNCKSDPTRTVSVAEVNGVESGGPGSRTHRTV